MIIETIKSRIKAATLSKSEVEKSTLKVILGEIERKIKEPSEDEIYSIIRKMIVSNQESVSYGKGLDRLKEEMDVMASLLPQELPMEEIEKWAQENTEMLKSLKSEGQAIGVAVKALKPVAASSGKILNSGVVADVVKKTRI